MELNNVSVARENQILARTRGKDVMMADQQANQMIGIDVSVPVVAR